MNRCLLQSKNYIYDSSLKTTKAKYKLLTLRSAPMLASASLLPLTCQ